MTTRSLKFRVWDGWQLNAPRLYLPTHQGLFLDINQAIQEENGIWMQFTGIIDKRGREIYECDEVVGTPIRSTEPGVRGVVEYDDLAARFVVRNERGLTKLDSNHYAYEVVGNAFQ